MSSTVLAVTSRVPAALLAVVVTALLALAPGALPPIAAQTEPLLDLDKTGVLDAGADGWASPGDVVDYDLLVTNLDGQCDITDIVASDLLLADLSCPETMLAPSAAMTCTGSYTIDQGDIDLGVVDNNATVEGLVCREFTEMASASFSVPLPAPAVELAKHGDVNLGADGIASAGEQIDYVLVITNIGNLDLLDLTLTDSLIASFSCPSGHPIPVLAIGASESCEGSYTMTQDDVDAGSKTNTAEVSALPSLPGTEGAEELPRVTAEASSTVAIAPVPAIELVKSGVLNTGVDGDADPGDLIDYTFETTNSGNVTLFEVTVSDPLVPMISCPGGNPLPTLAPGDSLVCSGSYAIVQSDIDEGARENTATSGALTPGEMPLSIDAFHSVELPVAGVGMAKSAALDLGADGIANPGDLISYDLVVTNTGSLELSDVTLDDPHLPAFTCPGGHPIPLLAVGAEVTCTGMYTVTQADIDAGFVENTAEVSAAEGGPGVAPLGRMVSAQATVRVNLPQQPLISIVKSGVLDLGANGLVDPGDLIAYDFQVSNTGNVTLTSVAVDDPLVMPVTCPSGNPIPSLAPGAGESCGGSYALTAANIATGSVTNTVEAEGMDPMTEPVVDGDSNTLALPEPMPTTGMPAILALALALVAAAAFALKRRAARR